jgi:hypothetical protein
MVTSHTPDIPDIQTTGRNISGHQHRLLISLEPVQSLQATDAERKT